MPEMKLTTNEARALVLLAKHGEITVAAMARQLGAPESNTSRVLASLKNKGLIRTERVRISKKPSLSDAKHAALLRKLVLEFPYMRFDKLLSGASLEVLSAPVKFSYTRTVLIAVWESSHLQSASLGSSASMTCTRKVCR